MKKTETSHSRQLWLGSLLAMSVLLAACNPSDSNNGGGGGGGGDKNKLRLSFQPTKVFHFEWDAVAGAEFYELLESPNGDPGTEITIAENIPAEVTHFDLEVPLFARTQAHYILQSCEEDDGLAVCVDVAEKSITDADVSKFVNSVGYIKAPDPMDALYYHNFGDAIALSGDGQTLAIGALEGADNNTNVQTPGVVYLYTYNGTGNWQFQQSIYSDSPNSDSNFGSSLSLNHDGDRLVIGASGDRDDNDVYTGIAYIYEPNGPDNSWTLQATLSPESAQEFSYFGTAVSISSDGLVVAIGAPEAYGKDHSETNIQEGFGAVYSFRKTDNWTTPEILRSIAPGTSYYFGSAVSLNHDGTVLAIGEPRATISKNGTEFVNAGAAYVFTRTNSTENWTPPSRPIVASNPAEEDDFGQTLSLSANGNRLAVGVPYDDSAGQTVFNLPNSSLPANDCASACTSGAVYVYHNEGGFWAPRAYIKASNAAEDDYFGKSVSINKDGTVLAVGAPYQNDVITGINPNQNLDSDDENYVGAAYTFTLKSGLWQQQSYLKASNAGVGDEFGNGIAISADGLTLAIAAASEDSGAKGVNDTSSEADILKSGAVYLY